MDNFHYLPLESALSIIRLIKLLPGTSIEVECEIFHTSIIGPDAVPFEALSYAWGSTELVESIKVNSSRLRVTENLQSALQCLRSYDKERILWIDAICINQNNLEERNQQVRQMGEIFRSASRVIFWLGKPTIEMELLMTTLMEINKQKCTFLEVSKGAGVHLIDFQADVSHKSQSGKSDSLLAQRKGLAQLLKRPWFQRVWILQEISNAQSAIVCCGKLSISAEIFFAASKYLAVDIDDHSRYILDIMPGPGRSESWWNQDQQRHLVNLNQKFAACKASDERDKVFALLGMSSEPRDQELLRIDYAKPIDRVVTDTARYWLEVAALPISKVLDAVANFNTIRATYLCFVEEEDHEPYDVIEIYAPPSLSKQSIECKRNFSRLLIEEYREESSDTVNACYVELDSSEVGLAKLQGQDAQQENRYIDAFRVVLWKANSQNLRILLIADIQRALIKAAANEWRETFKFILSNISWEKQERLNEALLRVAKSGSTGGVRILLDHGAEINFNNSMWSRPDNSALIAASRKGHLEVVEMLLNNGADVNLTSSGHPGNALIAACCEDRIDVIRMLLSRGAAAGIDYFDGYYAGTALSAAAAGKVIEGVQLLLDHGADVNYEPDEYHRHFETYQTPLMLASAMGNLGAMKLLLDHGARVNACFPEHGSALERAARSSQYEAVELLLQHGADVHLRLSKDHRSVPDVYPMRYDRDMEDLLREHGATLNHDFDLGPPIRLSESDEEPARATSSNRMRRHKSDSRGV